MPQFGGGFNPAVCRFARDLYRYALCGAGAVAADYGAFGLLTREGGLPLPLAEAISRPCGGLVSFVLNRQWTFRDRRSRPLGAQMLRYAAVWSGMYLAAVALVGLFDLGLKNTSLGPEYARWAAKISADGAAAFAGFLLNRQWTFRSAPETES